MTNPATPEEAFGDDAVAGTEAMPGPVRHFVDLVQGLDAVVWEMDAPTFRFTFVSERAEHLLGYPIKQWLDRPGFWQDVLLHPDDREWALDFCQCATRDSRDHVFEYRAIAADGRIVWLRDLVRVVPDDGGRADRLRGVMIDISEKKEAEEALRLANEQLERRVAERTAELATINAALEAEIAERVTATAELEKHEEHFRQLIETSHDLIQTLDQHGRIVYTGPSVERLLGYTADEIMGGGAPEYIHPDDRPLVQAKIVSAMSNPGQLMQAEYRVLHKDGRWRWFEALARTLSPETAEYGLVANARDVTERKIAEAGLARAKEEAERAREAAERANRAKSDFLSRMSHELRTPMNSILGFAQILDRAPLAPDQKKSVGHILSAGRHLLQLINEVLEIARIEAGRHALSLEPVRVSSVIQEAIGLVRPLASQWRVEVEEEPSEAFGVFVHADRQRLTQVLLNLFGNAIKYNRPGGRVSVSCEVTGFGDDARLIVRVHDTGKGIAPDRIDQLFTPFARLGAEQGEVEGTGLGLALSLRLTEAMGGTLSLESTDAQGSVFRLELLLTADPVHRLDVEADRAEPVDDIPHSAATILYIEDNLANLSLVETILLSRPRWRTLPALQGRIGLELACEHAPDLILLDLHLPDISGEEVLRRLRAEPRTAYIPVAVITADATTRTVDRLRSAGADAYLTKPIDIDVFLQTLERFLNVKE